MQSRLRIGGAARLKTGGPVMEICEINDSMALCRWVDGGELKSMVLPVSGLAPEGEGEGVPGAGASYI